MSKYVYTVVFFVLVSMCKGEASQLKKLKLYVPESAAKQWAEKNKSGAESKNAERIALRIANVPTAIWATNDDVAHIKRALEASGKKGEIVALVLYNIPGRDNGQYSSGGEGSLAGYKKFVDTLAQCIGKTAVLCIVEPDALMLMHDLPQQDQKIRCELLRYAVEALKKNPNAAVYLDGGHSNWHSPNETARRLKLCGIEQANGFAFNTSNFRETNELTIFGEKVSKLVGGKHFVLDTSRNGNGPWNSKAADAWCNPPGRALGKVPTLDTHHPLIDAFLWVKRPGESDGECRGGPKAGQFWPEYALELIKNSKE